MKETKNQKRHVCSVMFVFLIGFASYHVLKLMLPASVAIAIATGGALAISYPFSPKPSGKRIIWLVECALFAVLAFFIMRAWPDS